MKSTKHSGTASCAAAKVSLASEYKGGVVTSPSSSSKAGRPSALQQKPSWEHKLAFTLPEVMAIASCSNGYLYKAIGGGQLRAVKRGRRTLVLRADLDAWLNTFPAIQPKQPAA